MKLLENHTKLYAYGLDQFGRAMFFTYRSLRSTAPGAIHSSHVRRDGKSYIQFTFTYSPDEEPVEIPLCDDDLSVAEKACIALAYYKTFRMTGEFNELHSMLISVATTPAMSADVPD